MHEKIAIITITRGTNFGNRLQNYALQAVLEDHSVRPHTIRTADAVGNSLFLSKLKRLLRLPKVIITASRRRCYFKCFDIKYITIAKRIRYRGLNEHAFRDEYDAFIAGSDQIWNPTFWFNSDFDFITFADPSKRYSYAASFGISDIPQKYREAYAERLSQMKEISVREESAKEIILKLTNRHAMVHVDPTMLLPAERYSKIEQAPRHLPDKYLLVYTLGVFSAEYKAFVAQVAKQKNLAVVELNESPDSAYYHIGPQHFLYMLHHAEYICTDSFHGCAFSIIFHKQFTVFLRLGSENTMNSRIDTLLSKMELEDRLWGKLSLDDSLKPIPYDAVEKCLEKERVKACDYLRKIIQQW